MTINQQKNNGGLQASTLISVLKNMITDNVEHV